MGSDERNGVLELKAPGGFEGRAKGYRLMDIVCLVSAAGVIYGGVFLTTHAGETKSQADKVANTITEANRAIVQALKESQATTAEALRQVAIEQRRANEIGREQTCLLTLPPDRRTNAGDFCKRLSRERDR